MTRRRALAILVGLLLSGIAAFLAIRGVDLDRTTTILRGARLEWIPVAATLIVIQTVLRTDRWRRILPARPSGPPRLRRILPVTFVGYLANVVLPARLGEAVRVGLVSRRESLPFAATLGSIVIERVIDTVVLVAIGLSAALLVGISRDLLAIGMGGLLLVGAALAGLFIGPRLAARITLPGVERARELIAGLVSGADLRGRPNAVAAAVGLSAAAWVLDAIVFSVTARAVSVDLPLDRAMVIATVAALSTAIPSAPGYVGTFELATGFAAAAVGVDPSAALALAIAAHVLALGTVTVGGVIGAAAIGHELRGPADLATPAGDAPGSG